MLLATARGLVRDQTITLDSILQKNFLYPFCSVNHIVQLCTILELKTGILKLPGNLTIARIRQPYTKQLVLILSHFQLKTI